MKITENSSRFCSFVSKATVCNKELSDFLSPPAVTTRQLPSKQIYKPQKSIPEPRSNITKRLRSKRKTSAIYYTL